MKNKTTIFVLIALILISFLVWKSKNEKVEEVPGYSSQNDEETDIPQIQNTFPPDSELPPEVAETRMALIKAAQDKSYEELAEIIKDGEPKYSFGLDYPGGFIAWLKYEDSLYPQKTSFDNILDLLNQPYAKQTYSSGGANYVWPAKFVTENEYYGLRIFIDPSGYWTLYVSGD